jgi:hypothetical protein
MTRQLTQAAQAAREIRKELKKEFPHIKFSVRSQNFSMGDAVYVSYENGVSQKAVEAIISKYQYGTFNGMEDIYENTNRRNDIPQSMFIQISREITDDIADLSDGFKLEHIN